MTSVWIFFRVVDLYQHSLEERCKEGKCALAPEEVAKSAAIIGYGAVKYFDLRQNPQSDYQFSYER
jgi:arginyl-tRNA synthetase